MKKLFNYLKVFGAFTDAYQLVSLSKAPSGRDEKKLLEAAMKQINDSWARRAAVLQARQLQSGDPLDLDAEKKAFFPAEDGDNLLVPLQFLQDHLIKKMAALQNNVSIHNVEELKELREVFEQYGILTYPQFKGLTFSGINWSAKGAQKPKLMVHCKEAGEDICIRFEAASELCQKFMMSMLELNLKPEMTFDLRVEAVDPAIAKNQKAGKQVAEVGKYVNHNLYLTVNGRTHSGHPPKGQKFVQKPTLEFMETLFRQCQMSIQGK